MQAWLATTGAFCYKKLVHAWERYCVDEAAGEPTSRATTELRKQIWRRYRLELDKPQAEQDPAEIKRLQTHHLLLTEKYYKVRPATAHPPQHAAPTAASRRCAPYPALLNASGPLLVPSSPRSAAWSICCQLPSVSN